MPVRHAILGGGGVGGLVAGALARAGVNVLLLVRPASLSNHPASLRVDSVVLGGFEVRVAGATVLDREVDVLWITVKATQLEAALELAPSERVGAAVVVPLLNGVDHVALLHTHYEHVLAGAIGVESERVEPGRIRHKRGARLVLGPGARRDEIAADMRRAGFEVELARDEPTVLWEKLAFIAPVALTTTALGDSVGAVRADREWCARLMRCHAEVVAVGCAESATLDPSALRRLLEVVGGDMRTSMQKDFDAGRPLELDAIAGPVVRGGRQHGLETSATEELVHLVEMRLAASSA